MMKRLLAVVFVLGMMLAYPLSSSASDVLLISTSEQKKVQNHISTVGFKILNANELPNRTVFIYDSSKTINAYSAFFGRNIVLYRGMYIMLDDEDMLAAVLCHEISHSMDSYEGPFRGTFGFLNYTYAPKKYEYKADKRAVDFMVKAGYHPVAAIVMMNKVMGQNRYDWNSSHPLTSRRMMSVYEYIYKKYPEYLVDNKYKTNIYYQNFLLTSKENRAKFQKKIEKNSRGNVDYL